MDITWTNTNSGWDNTFSWNPSVVPGASDRAIFDDSSAIAGVAVGLNLSNDVVGDILFSAPTRGMFWKNTTNTLTVLNTFILDQSAAATAIHTLRTGTIAVTNASGTAVFKVGDYADGSKGLLTMQHQLTAGDTSITNYPVLIADNFLMVSNNATLNFTAGTLTTFGSTIDRGTNVFFDIAPAAGDISTWNILGGTNSINYIGTIGTNRFAFTNVGSLNINVNGPNTVWLVNGGEFDVGWNGFANLVISGGAQVTNRGTANISRNGTGSSNNTVTVTGAGSQWNLAGDLYIGRATKNNSLTISAGGVVNGAAGRLGESSAASGNTVTVTGSNSLWNLTTFLQIGAVSPGNSVIITNGGRVNNTGNGGVSARLGRDAASSGNSVIVDGAGSEWNTPTNMVVGNSGPLNSVIIKNGGYVNSWGAQIGAGSGSDNNTVTVDGAGSLWVANGIVTLGPAGAGDQVTVSNGGEVLCGGVDVGPATGANNSFLVAGGLLVATNNVSGAVVRVGGGGNVGTFTLNSGTVTVDQLNLASGSVSVFNFNGGVLNVKTSVVANSAAFVVGNGTSAATLNLTAFGHSFANGLTITNNGTLTGVGTITATVTLGNGSALAPGSIAVAGTQTVVGAVVLNPSTTLDYKFDSPGGAGDLVSVVGDLTLDGTLNVFNLGGFATGLYTVFSYTGTLNNNTLNIGTMPSGFSGTVSNDTVNKLVLLKATSTGPADPFAAWQTHYFPGGGPNAAGSADPDHDGVSNTNEFLTGFSPTNNAAYPHVTSIAKSGTNIVITYLGASGDNTWSPGIASRTNVLEFTTGTANGSFATNTFASTGQTNILSGGNGSGTVASFVDTNGASSTPSRYYRVRVLAP